MDGVDRVNVDAVDRAHVAVEHCVRIYEESTVRTWMGCMNLLRSATRLLEEATRLLGMK